MRDKYYFPFVPDAKVNYLFLFALWDRAEYNPPGSVKSFSQIGLQFLG